MRIFLVGFMGCGKTSLGKRLARRIGYDFADIDNMVEEKANKKIPEIIKQYGDDAFRIYEKEALLSLYSASNIIIATGGGTPCYNDNMNHILKMGKSVYLKMSPLSLASRIEESKTIRPLVDGKSGKELLQLVKEMLHEREKYYIQANCIIKGENAKPQHIISLLFG